MPLTGLRSIRGRILLSFGTLLMLGTLNMGVYHWGAQQRRAAYEQLQQAIRGYTVLTSVSNGLNDQRKFVSLMVGAFGGTEPPPPQEAVRFATTVDSLSAQITVLARSASLAQQDTLSRLDTTVRRVAAEWKAFYGSQGTDPTAAIMASVRAEMIAEELFAEALPAAVAGERERMNLASLRFEQTDRTATRMAWLIFLSSLLVGLPLATVATRSLLRGVEKLHGGVKQLGAGQLDHRIPLARHPDELDSVARSFNEMAEHLQHRTAEVEERTQQLQSANERLSHEVAERVEAQRALEDAKAAAERANETKSQFLANMSHELRTPLNAIIGYSEMLMEDAADDASDAMCADLQKIHGAGKHLLNLINDILDLSKVEAGKMELHLETFDIEALIADVAATVRPLVEKNRNVLLLEVTDPPGQMHADSGKVRQILFNLLSNASKFTDQGTITLTSTRLAGPGEAWVELRVRDSGIGMTAEQLDRLFQPFMQADASTTRRYGGSGLGLTISRHFCRIMGGEITVESEPRSGSTFIVRLPVHVREPSAENAGATRRRSRPIAVMADDLAPVRGTVLVIDDDASAREVIQRMLAKEGYRVIQASGGREGLRLARETRPDVITLDVMMPGMDGWAVLGALKADPVLALTPVVMLTIVDERILGSSLGAADYLLKPVNRERLSDALRKLVVSASSGTVLVVEDDPDARAMLRRMLERDGCTVIEAPNGREALAILATTRPSLVILDLMMPLMDGFAFVEQLRRHPEGAGIPVVVLTAKDLTDEDRERLQGVDNVLRKGSASREDLLVEVRRVLGIARPKSG
jgi:signal transduction histidine kinase/CheY-like chemotaxis protein